MSIHPQQFGKGSPKLPKRLSPKALSSPKDVLSARGLKRNLSFSRPICYHNLENVSLSDLYLLQRDQLSGSDRSLDINQNISRAADFLKSPAAAFHRRGIYNDNHCVSRSCPHSRRQSPTRQQNKKKALDEEELVCVGAVPAGTDDSALCREQSIRSDDNADMGATSADDNNIFCQPKGIKCFHNNMNININNTSRESADNSAFCGKDINDNDNGRTKTDVKFSTPVLKNSNLKDVNLNDMLDNDFARSCLNADSLSANTCDQRLDSVSFASLFRQCRYERDTNVPSTPLEEKDSRVVDPELLMTTVRELLCAERVSQMTRTTSDIEAVTHLLEEKERDLELAARIGQTLLSKNKELNSRVEALEDQLNHASDKVNQLRHDLSMKDELLKYYNEDFEQETGENAFSNSRSVLDSSGVDFLEKKVKLLEDENLNLRIESAQLKADTDSYEEKEKKLVEDCIQQLAEVNLQVESLAEDLHQKAEENLHYKDEANKLLGQVNDLQKKIRKLTLENMDIREKLTASTESQRRLTQELGTMQDKYDEILQMLEEAQDELRLIRSRERSMSRGHHHHSVYEDSTDSIASELETSLQQELSQSSRRNDNWKVFETARAAKQAAAKAMQRQTSSDTRMSLAPTSHHLNDSQGPLSFISDVESVASDSCSIDMDRIYESNPELGRPGIPGSNDLESALKRLAMRRANEQNEKDFHEEEMERRQISTVSDMHDGSSQFSRHSSGHPMFRSPMDSASSRWSSSGMSVNNQHYKLPEKLQIVKPLEGSMTLRQWQHLATPHLGGIFEERDGVQMKTSNKLDLSGNSTLSDFEDDDQTRDVHTRKEQDMGLIYTFTDSRVRNPGGYAGLGSLFGSSIPSNTSHTDASMKMEDSQDGQMPCLNSESQQQPQMSHLYKPAADNTQSTYSMSLGLASLLQGRENPSHAIMRASSPPVTTADDVTTASASFSNVNWTHTGSRSFDSQPLTSSTPKLFLGSRSFDHPLVKKDGPSSLVDSGNPKKTEPVVSTGKSLLQQLKTKSYSLYGLWGGASNKPDAESSTDGETLASGSTPTTKSAAESPLANGAEMGILGALTNLRRSGLL